MDKEKEIHHQDNVFVKNCARSGKIFSYAHYVVDCLLPEICQGIGDYKNIYRQLSFDQTIGQMKYIHEEIFKSNHYEVIKQPENMHKIVVMGFGWESQPKKDFYDKEKFDFAINFIYRQLNIKYDSTYPKIILIERGYCKDQLLTKKLNQQILKTDFAIYGKTRRYIKDIEIIDKYLNETIIEGQYKKIIIEDDIKSFREEVMYFYNADLIIGCSGAGLTNLLWMKPNKQVLEVYSDNHKNVFYNLANARDINHYFCDNNSQSTIEKIKEIIPFNYNKESL